MQRKAIPCSRPVPKLGRIAVCAFNDTQRRRLGVTARALGRKTLEQFASIVTPDTLLRWFRNLVAKKYNGAAKRGPGRPRRRDNIADLVLGNIMDKDPLFTACFRQKLKD